MDGCLIKKQDIFRHRPIYNFYVSTSLKNHDVHAELPSQAIRGNSLIHKIFTFLKPG